jgi:CheY-like chemotaxis protein
VSGFDVLERLKRDPRTSSIPVIVLTARTHPDERATALRLGAARFLTKPFSTSALLLELEGVLAATRGDGVGGPPPAGGGPPETSV